MRFVLLVFCLGASQSVFAADPGGAWVNAGTPESPKMMYCRAVQGSKPTCTPAEVSATPVPAAPAEPHASISAGPPAQVVSQPKPSETTDDGGPVGNFVSGTAGTVSVTGGDGGTYFGYGFRAGFEAFRDRGGIVSLGVSLVSATKDSTVSGTDVSETVTAIMVELLGRRLFGSGLFVGGRVGVGIVTVGLTKSSTNTQISSGSDTDLAVGPVAGYEFRVAEHVSIPLELSFISIGQGTTSNHIDFNAVSALIVQTGLVIHW